MKIRNSFVILCSAAFCFSFLASCNKKGKNSSGGGIPEGSYLVTFDTKGGTEVPNQIVKGGDRAKKPETDPTNDGQIFTGWFFDFEAVTPFDFDSAINSTTTIYAGWQIDRDSFYDGGGSSSGGGGGSVTYTCTDLPTWIGNDDAVIFAWTWTSGTDGAWHNASLSGTTATFTMDHEPSKFLLARCIAGTSVPNWDEAGDNIGRIYNKSDDIACSSGVHSFSIPEAKWHGNP